MSLFVEKKTKKPGYFIHDDEVGGQSMMLFVIKITRSTIDVEKVIN